MSVYSSFEVDQMSAFKRYVLAIAVNSVTVDIRVDVDEAHKPVATFGRSNTIEAVRKFDIINLSKVVT